MHLRSYVEPLSIMPIQGRFAVCYYHIPSTIQLCPFLYVFNFSHRWLIAIFGIWQISFLLSTHHCDNAVWLLYLEEKLWRHNQHEPINARSVPCGLLPSTQMGLMRSKGVINLVLHLHMRHLTGTESKED